MSREGSGRSRKKKGQWIYTVLIFIFAGVACFSGWKIISQLSEDKTAENAYESLAESFITDIEETQATASESEAKETSSPIMVDLPDGWSLKKVDFGALCDYNSDVVAWLELPGTIINYPVVQSYDNDYYLRRLLSGEHHRFGTLFVDYRNDPFNDDINIIYGHHIKAGDMFCILENYTEQSYLDEHPFFVLYTPEKTYRADVFAMNTVPADQELELGFANDEDFMRKIRSVKDNSPIETDITVTSDDRLLALYTCSYDYEDARYIVYTRLSEWN